jgi:LDH2 family malate/lactate/ureidoglycolate dehydrogenase
MKVSITDLEGKVAAGIARLGYENDDARIIKEVLLYAQMRGNNQGITKIATGGVPAAANVPEYKLVSENKCGALISGGQSMVSTQKAADLAVSLAEEHGVGIVGTNHATSSSGAIGYFTRQIADAGYIGIAVVGTPPFVAPTGSAEAKLGTNPISYAFPTSKQPVVFDSATAAMAYFGVVEAKLKGESLPSGVAFDKDGNPTTDAARALDGSVTTFGAHRGYGLSLLVQLLAGPLVGAAYCGASKDKGAGTLILAIDPGLLLDKAEYLVNSTDLCGLVSGAKPIASAEVQLPGERGDTIRSTATETNEIEISDAIWEELCSFVDTCR